MNDSMKTVLNKPYQIYDAPVFDYNLWEPLPGIVCRGPEIDLSKPYYVFCGAAQTFGRYVHEPFTSDVSKKMGVTILNLSVAGGGPEIFLRPGYLALINGSSGCVMQVLSGRSCNNSVFLSNGGQNLSLKREVVRIVCIKDAEYINKTLDANYSVGDWLDKGAVLPANVFYSLLIKSVSEDVLISVVEETRRNYESKFFELYSEITVPKKLMYFSRRKADYFIKYNNVKKMFGDYPQLVDQGVINVLEESWGRVIEVITNEGSPEIIRDRSGEAQFLYKKDCGKVSKNNTYPSQLMHNFCAGKIIEEWPF